MNKRTVIAEINECANYFDENNQPEIADELTRIAVKIAQTNGNPFNIGGERIDGGISAPEDNMPEPNNFNSEPRALNIPDGDGDIKPFSLGDNGGIDEFDEPMGFPHRWTDDSDSDLDDYAEDYDSEFDLDDDTEDDNAPDSFGWLQDLADNRDTPFGEQLDGGGEIDF